MKAHKWMWRRVKLSAEVNATHYWKHRYEKDRSPCDVWEREKNCNAWMNMSRPEESRSLYTEWEGEKDYNAWIATRKESGGEALLHRSETCTYHHVKVLHANFGGVQSIDGGPFSMDDCMHRWTLLHVPWSEIHRQGPWFHGWGRVICGSCYECAWSRKKAGSYLWITLEKEEMSNSLRKKGKILVEQSTTDGLNISQNKILQLINTE